MNVNRFGQSAWELPTVALRGKSITAYKIKRNKFFSARNMPHINLDIKEKKLNFFSNDNSLEKNYKTEDDIKINRNKSLFLRMENELNNNNHNNQQFKNKINLNVIEIKNINSNEEDIININNDNNGNKALGKMFSFEFGKTKN